MSRPASTCPAPVSRRCPGCSRAGGIACLADPFRSQFSLAGPAWCCVAWGAYHGEPDASIAPSSSGRFGDRLVGTARRPGRIPASEQAKNRLAGGAGRMPSGAEPTNGPVGRRMRPRPPVPHPIAGNGRVRLHLVTRAARGEFGHEEWAAWRRESWQHLRYQEAMNAPRNLSLPSLSSLARPTWFRPANALITRLARPRRTEPVGRRPTRPIGLSVLRPGSAGRTSRGPKGRNCPRPGPSRPRRRRRPSGRRGWGRWRRPQPGAHRADAARGPRPYPGLGRPHRDPEGIRGCCRGSTPAGSSRESRPGARPPSRETIRPPIIDIDGIVCTSKRTAAHRGTDWSSRGVRPIRLRPPR
jgi:hypothetical protein